MVAQQTALRKRQQIASANRTMFLWVAGASVIVGAALVVAVFMTNKLIFTGRVIAKKNSTVSTLDKNLSAINTLKERIRVLNTNQNLQSVMTSDETDPVQVVLDALPSTANSTALGASLQQRLLNQPGITIDSVVVDQPQGELAPTDTSDSTASNSSTTADTSVTSNVITFNFVVHADGNDVQAIKNLLETLEKSIRTIDLTNVSLDYQGGQLQLTGSGQAFYQPPMTTKLGKETVKP